MMTPSERDQLLAGYALHMELTDRGIPCGIDTSPEDAPRVRLAGADAIEATPTADGHYDIWEVGEPLAPLAFYLSLAEAAALLAAPEHSA